MEQIHSAAPRPLITNHDSTRGFRMATADGRGKRCRREFNLPEHTQGFRLYESSWHHALGALGERPVKVVQYTPFYSGGLH